MTDTVRRSWFLDRPLTGFALPRGRVGSVLGRFMAAVNKDEQREAFALADPQPGERVLEAGYGPGVLVQLMLSAGAAVGGVDPSPEMCELARRRNRRASVEKRADLRVGSAENTGFPDDTFDLAVSVNNVPMWSDLRAGMRELRRVVRPGGRVVVTWHGGSDVRWIASKLVLPGEVLDHILATMREEFGGGERHDGEHVVAFRAEVPGS